VTADTLSAVARDIATCRLCERLRTYCAGVGQTKRRAFLDQEYWARPVPSWGDETARLLLIGLAPGAHGSNRTGRMFTGDRSGDWLFRALYDAGFASRPVAHTREDGLELHQTYITAAAHCAPPDNKPLPGELAHCARYLERELHLLKQVRVVVLLGKVAFDAYLRLLAERGVVSRRGAFRFAHGAEFRPVADGPLLIACYHPSQQNTSTGRLTAPMLAEVFERARRECAAGQ
jgi:uracil-DNA glycosylase